MRSPVRQLPPVTRLVPVLLAPLLALLMAAPMVGATPIAPVQTETTSPGVTTSDVTAVDANPGIIVKPNAGTKPADPGARGGWLQSVLFAGVLASIAVIALLVYRQSRRALALREQAVRTNAGPPVQGRGNQGR